MNHDGHNPELSFAQSLWRYCKLAFTAFIILCLAVIIVANILIKQYANTEHHTNNATAMIVLGAKIVGDPLEPSSSLKMRLDAALTYWANAPDIQIIVSGGKTQGFAQSEAEVMKNYLVKQGIPPEQILMEDQSTRTAHQFIYSKRLMKLDHVVIVTNDFHLMRSMMLAKRSGLDDAVGLAAPTPTDSWAILSAYIREPFALVNSWLFDHPKD